MRAERAKNEHPLGDTPLVVLMRGISDETGPNAKRLEEDHQREQLALAMLSRNVVAAHSGHHIQLDEPDLVIQSIGEVLKAVRKVTARM